jgi:hypothetical protein
MPGGKAAGVRCTQLTADNLCRLFGTPPRPAVCRDLQPAAEMCRSDRAEAIEWLTQLELETLPG